MDSNSVRKSFLDFFVSKTHKIVSSASIVVKNDPTLMFTNAGMNQFKDIFLGHSEITDNRIANTQKCLRVSGKHNDLDEVGYDTYHHTMFEMLGNWSFGDYFKKEAIEWAWEYLTDVLKIDKSKLYVTIFDGNKEDGLSLDNEAKKYWQKFLPDSCIINGSKKYNFWEMGEIGPCGPCSEIHIDLRTEEERKKIDGKDLVNKDHPQVIEIWNLVFIQYNRKSNRKLEILPLKHVDTGMGFERLCMVVQGKTSNYDTDIFIPLINKIEDISGLRFRKEDRSKRAAIVKTAMRVIADHVRAISFSIADGQLPSNTGSGYVIRRILRRAVRYGYQSLNLKEPFIFRLVPVLVHQLAKAYPELKEQKLLIEKVIKEEETAFFKTLSNGLKLIDQICIEIANKNNEKIIDGKKVFELYDTYGFPIDLTSLIANEYGLTIDDENFKIELNKQKDRSRKVTNFDTEDWVEIEKDDIEEFIGYDQLSTNVKITKYRKIRIQKKEQYQLVFNFTPFYAESGGQVGDTGYIESENEKIFIVDTKLENKLIVHITDKLPKNVKAKFKAVVNEQKRLGITNNHTATHLLHTALRNMLGNHIEQKGSFVNSEHIRFDFSHFQKLSDKEIEKVEFYVNQKIRQNIDLEEKRGIPMEEAQKMGAIALFGEKYGDIVRVIKFDNSVELCGGTHVRSTGQIGSFKIISESAIAAGIRRIEAVTGLKTEEYINNQLNVLDNVKELIKSPNIIQGVQNLLSENEDLNKKVEKFNKEKILQLKSDLKKKIQNINGISVIAHLIEIDDATIIKDISFQLKGEIDDLFLVIGANINNKPNISIMISDNLVKEKDLNAGNIIREVSKEIKGGGGGQAFYATAGGKDVNGLKKAIEKTLEFLK